MRGLFFIVIALAALPAAAERICVEDVAGVCLKYREAPVASPARNAEAALGLGLADRRSVQRGLAGAGFYTGGVDGALGPQSRKAISAWQRANGFNATGFLTSAQVGRLKAAAPAPVEDPAAVEAPTSAEKDAQVAVAVPAKPSKPVDPRDGTWTGAMKCNRVSGDYGNPSFLSPSGRPLVIRIANGSGAWNWSGGSSRRYEKWKVSLNADGDARITGSYRFDRDPRDIYFSGDWRGDRLELSGTRGPRRCRLNLTRQPN